MAFFINYFYGTTKSALGAANQDQRTDGVDRGALATDDLAHVGRVNAQFVNGGAVTFGRGDGHRIRAVNQPFNYIVQKGFHK
jgi:hypothetical protein